ncbi:MAG: glycoside hydrolase family 1 protein [Candidatus Sericytochromatia bacterium]
MLRRWPYALLLSASVAAWAVRRKPRLSAPAGEAFPPDFVWGTATSAYQVEGGIANNFSVAGLDAGQAVDHWRRYAEDYDHAQALGLGAFRLSLEWARLEPAPGVWDEAALAQYREMMQALRARGLTPCVTLWHFTHPSWFEARGGWENPANLSLFLAYVRKVVSALPEVDWWATLNEPLVFAFQAYDNGVWPPFGKSRARALQVARNLLLAHAEAYHLIHGLNPQARVGLVKNMTVMDPLLPHHPRSRLMTRIQSWLFNAVFWQALCTGRLDIRLPGMPRIWLGPEARLQGALDFMGINYYTRYLIGTQGEMVTAPNTPRTELDWEIYPAGLGRMLRLAAPYAKRLGVPIYITENGLADASDGQRQAFLEAHLRVVLQAIAEGVPVKGYFYWSLLDNFEWAEGDAPAFGLLDRARGWRPSASWFQQLVRQNRLGNEADGDS